MTSKEAYPVSLRPTRIRIGMLYRVQLQSREQCQYRNCHKALNIAEDELEKRSAQLEYHKRTHPSPDELYKQNKDTVNAVLETLRKSKEFKLEADLRRLFEI